MGLKRSVTRCVAILAVVAALVWVGHASKQDALQEQAHYCVMVKAGAWPDYRHTYKQECKP